MAIINNDRFQGMCLQSVEGRDLMNSFDQLPPLARNRLRQSPFNICPACVNDAVNERGRFHDITPSDYEEVISSFENQIRRLEGEQAA